MQRYKGEHPKEDEPVETPSKPVDSGSSKPLDDIIRPSGLPGTRNNETFRKDYEPEDEDEDDSDGEDITYEEDN